MVIAIGGLLIAILLILSGIHFYWAIGGEWGFLKALPTNKEGMTVLNPKAFDSAVVGFGLLIFAFFYCLKIGVFSTALPNWLFLYGGWIVPAIFLLRVIGDTKYVGLFKKVKTTEFAKRDTKYFVPLCILLTVAGFVVQMYS